MTEGALLRPLCEALCLVKDVSACKGEAMRGRDIGCVRLVSGALEREVHCRVAVDVADIVCFLVVQEQVLLLE